MRCGNLGVRSRRLGVVLKIVYIHLLGDARGEQVMTMVFTGLVDVSRVESIEISGGDDGMVETYEFTPAT